jgi:2-aminoethylphosphonate-pyruvate transaminase
MEFPKLFTPGPLEISYRVKIQMLQDIGSRDDHLIDITRNIREISLDLAHATTSHECIPIGGSGTYGIEAVIDTFIDKYDKPLVLVNGMYGERITAILKKQGVEHEIIIEDNNKIHDIDIVEAHILNNKPTHLIFVYCETTTGIQNPFHELVMLAKKHDIMTIVDGVSAFGALPVDASRTPFDVLVTSSNKCLESVPGISLCLVSKKVLFERKSKACSYCLDLCDQWKLLYETGQWRCTPPTHVLQALNTALRDVKNETIKARYKRYKANMDIIVKELAKVNLKPCVDPKNQSPICLAFSVRHLGDSFNYDEFYNQLKARGILIYHKMDENTKSFRIGCIGGLHQGDFKYMAVSVKDVISQISYIQGCELKEEDVA